MDHTKVGGHSRVRREGSVTKQWLHKVIVSGSKRLEASLVRHEVPDRIPFWGAATRPVFSELYGVDLAKSRAAAYTLQTAFIAVGTACLTGAAGVLLRDGLIGMTACMTLLLVPAYQVKAIRRKGAVRKRDIVIELPAFVSTVMLFVGAGDAVPNAVIRAVERKLAVAPEAASHPLYQGLAEVTTRLRHNVSFPKAMEGWSRRSGVREIAAFCSAVLLLQKRGGDEFVYALNELTRSLWEKRKAEARIAGEEAASKLVFPMVIIFVVVMLIVGAPAYLMGQP